MSKDIKMLLLAGVGIGFFAWGLMYSQQFGQLVSASTNGYGNVVRALEPPGMGGASSFNSGGGISNPGGYSGLTGA